jgi:hypothetical protein
MPSTTPSLGLSMTGGNTGMESTLREPTVCSNLTGECALWTTKWTDPKGSMPLYGRSSPVSILA